MRRLKGGISKELYNLLGAVAHDALHHIELLGICNNLIWGTTHYHTHARHIIRKERDTYN